MWLLVAGIVAVLRRLIAFPFGGVQNRLAENPALIMFATMIIVIFGGYPVALVLGDTAPVFAQVAWSLGEFNLMRLDSISLRI